ncbi:alpha/beta hydrolase [Salipaludibacillus aurantiacus]|uniref:Serine aminopeptidase S33 domain-containing protein n=1 Tax=Salipaludibacillus aurantiacus TaxID=1601833 RepID=A0A1H9TFH0_9BACI|nr:alpha/beta fold hydrolase [Salipaludibacillus aurantiacus]SER95846.1 hypothetical protein SAMN05518684_105305 [Salipaludibacillus aurantiacus]
MSVNQILKYIIYLFLTIFILYGLYVFLFYVNQENDLFQEPDLSREKAQEINAENKKAEELFIETEDGTSLHGWLLNNSNHSPSRLLIYFGGNSEEVSRTLPEFEQLNDWSVLLVNHRGYGLSEGTPSEAALFHDAKAIYDFISEREEIDSEHIAVMGRSMGTAPATHLSKERNVAGTVLVSPYDSRTRVMKDRYPLIPVERLIRHPFKVSDKAESIESPLLALLASEDEIIPTEHSAATLAAWKGESQKVWLEGYNHNNLQSSPDFWKSIQTFLDEL